MSDTMLTVSAELRLRNAAMVTARKQLGMSQSRLAAALGVSVSVIQRLEKFDYSHKADAVEVERIAGFLTVDPSVIMPEDLRGQQIQSSFFATRGVAAAKLLDLQARCEERLLLASPEEQLGIKERSATIKKVLGELSFREREILRLRFGLGGEPVHTIYATAKKIGVPRERVRQIEQKALGKMKRRMVTPLNCQSPMKDVAVEVE